MGMLDFIKISYWFGGPDLTKSEVAEVIEDFLDNKGGEWDWDDLISISMKDKELEKVRLFCGDTRDLYPPKTKADGWCSDEGAEKLQEVADWLRGKIEKPKFLEDFDP